jgi:glycosyltransferase involved in cell wall biosynthesis
MRIGFLCAHNPLDRHSFSGTAHYAYMGLLKALQSGEIAELRLLGSHRPPTRLRKYASAVKHRLGVADRKLEFTTGQDLGEGLDWIISLVSSGLAVSLAARLKAPLVHVTDSTPQFIREFYGSGIEAEGEAVEREMIGISARVIYSSDYMRDRAIAEFGSEFGSKLRAIPFGVNLDELPQLVKRLDSRLAPGGTISLLFIGREWERKGGPLALAAVEHLQAEGMDAQLTIIGCDPAEATGKIGVKTISYLNKDNPDDVRQLNKLMDSTHLLVLPTRADCTPMVIAEANAHSVPAIVTNVGGIASLVSDGVNGQLMPLDANGKQWADVIKELTASGERYSALRESSFVHFQRRLNWSAWARDLIADLS